MVEPLVDVHLTDMFPDVDVVHFPFANNVDPDDEETENVFSVPMDVN